MKTTGERWHLRDRFALAKFIESVKERWKAETYPTVTFLEADRSTHQNAMFYALYRDIAEQMEDRSLIDVRRDCKLRYGVVIRKAADPEWSAWYDSNIKPMPMEAKLFLMDDYPITSTFTKAQASEYIDSIIADYTRHGYALARPDAYP